VATWRLSLDSRRTASSSARERSLGVLGPGFVLRVTGLDHARKVVPELAGGLEDAQPAARRTAAESTIERTTLPVMSSRMFMTPWIPVELFAAQSTENPFCYGNTTLRRLVEYGIKDRAVWLAGSTR
jgi:hypothetical protein